MAANPAPGFLKHPAHKISIERLAGHLRVHAKGHVIAESDRALLVDESRHDLVHYVPKADLRGLTLERSRTRTYCPFKGYADHWTVRFADGTIVEDGAWSYEEPYDECLALKGHVAFYADRMDLETETAA